MTFNSVLSAPLVLGVRVYQRLISPLTSPNCRFYPSCSAYAVAALVRFGPLRGSWLAIRRLGRCHPWNPGGVDLVPQTWAGRNDVRPEDFRPDTDGEPSSSYSRIDNRIDSGAAATSIRHDCRSVVHGKRTTHQTTEELR